MFAKHRDDRRDDPNWEIAGSIPIVAVDAVWDPETLGRIVAAAHPTGWFVRAERQRDLPVEDVEGFAQFVLVRTYLLLTQGPRPGVWERTDVDHRWRASFTAPCRPVQELVPDAVPSDW